MECTQVIGVLLLFIVVAGVIFSMGYIMGKDSGYNPDEW